MDLEALYQESEAGLPSRVATPMISLVPRPWHVPSASCPLSFHAKAHAYLLSNLPGASFSAASCLLQSGLGRSLGALLRSRSLLQHSVL